MPPAPAKDPGKFKVAIVEDSAATRRGLESILKQSSDYECAASCGTAEEALRQIPRILVDIVLMDIQLPNMSGIECAARIKELLPSVHVLMVTVFENSDRIFSALRAGASGYILKRATPEEILDALGQLRNGGVPMSAEIARKVIAFFREQEAATTEVQQLTPREKEVLDLVVQGFSNREIAGRLFVTIEAVRWHLKGIYQKLHVHSRTAAVLKVRPQG